MRQNYYCAGRCWFCGTELLRTGNGPNRLTIDHLLPRCRGGRNDSANTVKACSKCNSAKGALTLEEYRAVVKIRRHDIHGAAVMFWAEIPGNWRLYNRIYTSPLGEKLSAALAQMDRAVAS